MIFVGIDPGRHGALVAIDEHGGLVWWLDMPIVANQIDVVRLANELGDRALELGPDMDHVAFVERQHAMPVIVRSDDTGQVVRMLRGSNVGAFKQGESFGQLCGILAALRIRYECPSAQAWQRAVLPVLKGMGSPKERSALIAAQLFPALPIRGARGALKDGRADAACIAEYGRRQFVRQTLEVAQ